MDLVAIDIASGPYRQSLGIHRLAERFDLSLLMYNEVRQQEEGDEAEDMRQLPDTVSTRA